MDYMITHHPDKKRFETQVDGVTAFVQYRFPGINWISFTQLFLLLSEDGGLLPLW